MIEVPEDLLRSMFQLLGKHVYFRGNGLRSSRMSYEPEYLRIHDAIEALLPCVECKRFVDPNAGEMLMGDVCNLCRRRQVEAEHAA